MKQWTARLFLCTSMAVCAHTPHHYTITNTINREMTGFSFWKTRYYPDRLDICVNGKPIAQGDSIEIPASDKKMTVRYDYSFAGGFRTGAKEVTFELNSQKKDYQLNFSWQDKWRISADGALPLEVKRMRYKA